MSETTQSGDSNDCAKKSFGLGNILLIGGLLIGGSWWFFARTGDELADDQDQPGVNPDIVVSEALILGLTPRLKAELVPAVMNLSFEVGAGSILMDYVQSNDIATPLFFSDQVTERLGIKKWKWRGDGPRGRVDVARIWQSMFQMVDYFEHAKFSIVSAKFLAEDRSRLSTKVAFSAQAIDGTRQPVAVKANLEFVWQFEAVDPGDENAETQHGEDGHAPKREFPLTELQNPNAWKISEFFTDAMLVEVGSQFLFDDSLDRVIVSDNLLSRLSNSKHEQYILSKYKAVKAAAKKQDLDTKPDQEQTGDSGDQEGNDKPIVEWDAPHPLFSVVAQDRHPGVSVVDIDQDGFDDLYVMSRWEKNVLLRNQGDGTFVDVAADYGLDIDSHCSCAIFADFDNDGDADLFLGRTLKPSLFMVNESGKFIDRTAELIDGRLPALVSSISVADFNSDGLLDVYFSTYAANLLHDQREEAKNDVGYLSDFLSADDSETLTKKMNRPTHNRYLDYAGPPNLLLVNKGGNRFTRAKHNEQVEGWRHTYQASWNDFDQDGDPDLYLANDFAVNDLFRNDGPDGFVNVAEETNSTDIGFGMGASWGDFNNDTKLDLYVSNMFSKAGRRITGQLDQIDERFARMAGGNSLFLAKDNRFKKISGTELPKVLVEKAGWSWGSQFVDFNNDGWLDVYALSGYYTAPDSVAVQTDL